MANIKLEKIEYHQVNSHFKYEIPEESAIETFGSVQRFKEIISHLGPDFGGVEAFGEKPTDEEDDKLIDFLAEFDYDREEDWWTDRKGGYEISYEINNE